MSEPPLNRMGKGSWCGFWGTMSQQSSPCLPSDEEAAHLDDIRVKDWEVEGSGREGFPEIWTGPSEECRHHDSEFA